MMKYRHIWTDLFGNIGASIGKKELKNLVKVLSQSDEDPDDDFVSQVFRAYDKNHDGVISFDGLYY